ncbi:neuronal acetylcholine receptor subunit alpha-10-like isoform X2 [Haliotis rubra]|uniref:neuronal acetylcholine receptor subunit alpha-10-like isoform X2 n=1 Tax=Haliotis rubra TaxID=36100 RepID=UPI001EE605C0|nr:neuronal acetylcholine receptor subunit alpha-10-like isoform X2 [Haliotis rubra]
MVRGATPMAVVGVVIIIGMFVTGGHGNQTALMDKVFDLYHKEVRPICGTDAPIEVKIGIAIRQVIELDEPKQILTLNAWLRLNWYDCQLKWNATEFGGISSLSLPFSTVWTPDITLYDNAAEELVGLKDYRPVINSDGSASYNFPTIITSLCKVDVTYFPFDTQTCALKFGSWAYHGLQINSTNRDSTGDISSFKVNTEWDLVGVPVKRHVVYYKCCPEPYPDVTFYVNLRRKPLFYMLNLLFPCILITTVALLGFMLPPDSGEKVSLEITVLLSLAVFLLVVSETLPPTSEDFPLIGIYFCLAMMLVTFSTVLTVIVLNVHFKGQHGIGVPRWVRSLFLGSLARFLCVKKEMTVHPIKIAVNGDLDLFLESHTDDLNKTNQNGVKHIDSRGTEVQDLQQSSPLKKVMKEQLAVLKKINSRYAEKHKIETIGEEWKKVAIVMDRLFLVIFFLLSIICTLGILLMCVNNG